MPFDLIQFPDETSLAHAVASRWVDELAARNPAEPYRVALSGGRVAKTFFIETARQVVARGISLAGVQFFWGDERCVPPTDSESNYAAAYQLLLEPLKVPANQIHRVRGEIEEALALREIVDDILSGTRADAKGQPVLEMVFLGMGEDGHVASLFPEEPEAVRVDPAVYRAVTAVKPPPRRITVGYGVLMAAKEVWVIASGRGKEEALRKSVSPGGGTPLARVLGARSQTKIFTDIRLD